MEESLTGSAKAVATLKRKYGDDYFKRIGSMADRTGHKGGFAADNERAKSAGRLGGMKSKRGKAKVVD